MGLDLPEGKVKYQDERVINLDKNLRRKRSRPSMRNLSRTTISSATASIIARDRVWDLLIVDMEKLETRRDRATDDFEKQLLTKCLEYLERKCPCARLIFPKKNWPS